MKKRTRVLALTVAAAMSASLLAGCGSSAQQGEAAASSEAPASTTAAADGEEDNIIRVGVVCSMTGGSAIYGEGAQNAIDMAVEEINAGDSGYKIEIVNGGKVADDAKDAKQAMNAYNKVMADSPEAIVGSFFSSVTLPMAEQASKDGMLLLATGATNADVTLKGDTIFRNCFIDPYQGKMAALFAKDKGFTKAAVIYAKDDDYSNGLKDAFIENCEANGIEVAYTGECMTTDTDYSSQAAQAVHAYPERRYSIVRMDIDRFKVINDLYGLKEGDKLLIAIADLLREKMAGTHSVYGRLGGDVFCLCVDYSRERILAGNAQGAGRRAGGDDHRAALKDALAGVQRLDPPGKANLVHLCQLRHRAEALGALLHFFAQRKAVDAVLKAGIVVDLLRQRHLPAGGELFQYHYRKPASGGVQGGGVSGGAAADDDHIIDLLHSHALTAPAFPG